MTSYRTETNEPERWNDCDLSDSWDDRYNLDFGNPERSESESPVEPYCDPPAAVPETEITSPAVEVLAQVEIHAELLPEPEETQTSSPR